MMARGQFHGVNIGHRVKAESKRRWAGIQDTGCSSENSEFRIQEARGKRQGSRNDGMMEWGKTGGSGHRAAGSYENAGLDTDGIDLVWIPDIRRRRIPG